jgi:hypothetical protein
MVVGSAGELTLTSGGQSQTLVRATAPACCDPLTKPHGPEGAWCCANGWQLDIGSGKQDQTCASNGGAAPVCEPPPPPPTTCCDPAAKPTGGREGTWCCSDGWQYDIGSGKQDQTCAAHGGAGEVCANSCFGAWRDHNGGCRAPNDGAYPESCCTGL